MCIYGVLYKTSLLMYYLILTVTRPPTWARNMEFHPELLETAGKTLVLKCPAEGYPAPEINWFKDNEPLLSRAIGRVRMWT